MSLAKEIEDTIRQADNPVEGVSIVKTVLQSAAIDAAYAIAHEVLSEAGVRADVKIERRW